MVKLMTVQVGSDKLLFLRSLVGRQFPEDARDAKSVHMSFTDISATFKKVTGDSSYDKSTSSPFSFLFNDIAYRQ